MTYQLNFPALWPYLPQLLAGLWTTIELTFMATVGGIALGIAGAAIRCGNNATLRRIWGIYVEAIRNTPFVVQLFFIVFARPRCWRC
jgi:polar amino acid transport system permease protein